MASPEVSAHGKLGNIYVLRPNGFKGSGLNDLTWGAFSSGSDSCHFEVVIDGVGTGGGGCDTFKWRENGGEWTETVDITGASQNLVGTNGTQAITFGATTGHTADDQWSRGNLYSEACTESTNTAQITDTNLRLINPNATLIWTDTGSETVLKTDYTQGLAYFTGNVTVVTVSGDNGYILESGLQQVGYLLDWNIGVNCELAGAARQGEDWKEWVASLGDARGTARKMFIGGVSFFQDFEDCVDSQAIFLIQLFNYDPDGDQTGDHFNLWVIFNSFNANSPLTGIVQEDVGFTVYGMSSFTANS